MLPPARNGGKKNMCILIQMKLTCFVCYPSPLKTLFHIKICFHSYHRVTGTLYFFKGFSVSFVPSHLRVLEFAVNRNRQFLLCHLLSFHLMLFSLPHPNNTIITHWIMPGFCCGLSEQPFAPAFLLSSTITMGSPWQKHLSQYLIK